MGRVILAMSLLSFSLIPASCWTVYRYSHYDYSEPTIDEKNKEREQAIDRRFYRIMPGSDYPRKWRR